MPGESILQASETEGASLLGRRQKCSGYGERNSKVDLPPEEARQMRTERGSTPGSDL